MIWLKKVSRIIGYDEIPREEFKISKSYTKLPTKRKEQNIKNFLIDNGFFEIINNPFTSIKSKGSIKIDNPLDSNRKFLRSNLKNSLVENLYIMKEDKKTRLNFLKYPMSTSILTKSKRVGCWELLLAVELGRTIEISLDGLMKIIFQTF